MGINTWSIDTFHITIRLILAIFLGGIVGFEREQNNHAAGFRTHILVSLGSTLIMILSIYGFSELSQQQNVRMDPARLAAAVISGIGFLGAGTILRNGMSITGLTTAASLWVVAGIGLAVGAGYYYAATLSAVLVLLVLLVLNRVEKKYLNNKRSYKLKIETYDQPGYIELISNLLKSKGILIGKTKISNHHSRTENLPTQVRITMYITTSKKDQIQQILEELNQIKSHLSVEVE